MYSTYSERFVRKGSSYISHISVFSTKNGKRLLFDICIDRATTVNKFLYEKTTKMSIAWLHSLTHSLTHSPPLLYFHTPNYVKILIFSHPFYKELGIFQNIIKIGTLKDFQLWLSNTYSYSNSQLLYLLLYSTYRSIFIAFFLFFAKILPTTIKMLNSFIYRFSKWQKS